MILNNRLKLAFLKTEQPLPTFGNPCAKSILIVIGGSCVPFFLVVYLWSWRQVMRDRSFYPCTSLCLVKRPLGYVFRVVSSHVASWFVAAHDVRAFHTISVDVCLSNTEFHALLPNNLRKVTCTPATTLLPKRVSWLADFVVPVKRNVVSISFLIDNRF